MNSNYIGEITSRLAVWLPDCPPELLRLYALLVLVQGHCTSLEDVHDAWACWRAATRPDHPALIPFADLSPEVQELDRKYMEAIHLVAAEVAAS